MLAISVSLELMLLALVVMLDSTSVKSPKAKVPSIVASSLNVAAPVTANVLARVVAPVTSKVLAKVVAPVTTLQLVQIIQFMVHML